ncbi:hypothetical protein SAMN04487948_12928 [Halogranum amylolyticum]|uniref:Uncharacterized protein n=1 Tax=Halogranum amylolyticum TaxID=660520 RepID=A0A1H8WGE4_9EURY|nr:hypothetical protein SAMN04487948_12928 [Halogranum amylolyticum]
MPFSVSWHTLCDTLEDLPEGATLSTPLSHDRFRLLDVQDHRVVIQVAPTDETRPLQREQFETLYDRIQDAANGFDLDRLPPGADPYPAVLSVHPRFEVVDETPAFQATVQMEVQAKVVAVAGLSGEGTFEERDSPTSSLPRAELLSHRLDRLV